MDIVSEHHTEEGTKSDSATAGTVMRTRKKVEAFLKAAAGMSWENAALTLGLPAFRTTFLPLPPTLLARSTKLAPSSRPTAPNVSAFWCLPPPPPAYASPPS